MAFLKFNKAELVNLSDSLKREITSPPCLVLLTSRCEHHQPITKFSIEKTTWNSLGMSVKIVSFFSSNNPADYGCFPMRLREAK